MHYYKKEINGNISLYCSFKEPIRKHDLTCITLEEYNEIKDELEKQALMQEAALASEYQEPESTLI